ncbi:MULTISPECIES: LemA family protein [Bacteroidales]|jgi:LemA protein|uniref:LemA family protein n=1 Tax=Bacteroides thetaiotaomicron TaxID=818 RepID=A0A415LT53_BACT4|nr:MULTISPECIES: LemA family protein [Bacteroidaceae]MDV7053357.1 LemA family protein [Bacteroides ovatus]RGP07430.1 LemA family protein [Bacteroides ovatus]RHE02151.1 LemA family protein [Bacteroides ovatus]RHL51640.1 LemA family protein [Phocaeicola vulgatus]RHL52087.1 LemA family protein [Bacteroides thetaiotaomicron]
MIIIILCIVVILFVILLWAVFTSNNLIAKRNRVKQCRSGICVALKQRNSLIPNLVSAVKAYMGHENEILTRIAELRSKVSVATESEQIKGGTEISSLLARLQVAVEDYPELKANEQFLHLQGQIEEMENELQAIRRTYNAAVTDYNNAIEMFPSSIIASWRKHEQQELVEFPESEIRDVKVGELFK